MAENLIHNRGRGPEIVGTRITVYNLLPYFLDPTVTESYIAKLYDLSVEQVAAARAYVLNNADSVLATHLQIEDRIAAGNPPEVIEQAKRTHERFVQFKEWLEKRKKAEAAVEDEKKGAASKVSFPSYQEWLTTHQSSEQA